MKIYYEKTDRSIGILEGERRFIPLYHPLTLRGRFLPRALQPAAVGGRGGTSNPISLSLQELTLLRRLNPSYAQWRWLFGIGPGWPYRIPEEELARLADIGITEEQWVYANSVDWASAVWMAGNWALISEYKDRWAHVVGVPTDALMTVQNLNPERTPELVHRIWCANALPGYRNPPGCGETYSVLWERKGRPNSYEPDGSIWIDMAFLGLNRRPLPWERA